MNPSDCYDLPKLHTRVLMQYRDRCHKLGGSYDPTDNNGKCIPLADILSELNTREHIPNKQEAKIIRQTKAKQKR